MGFLTSGNQCQISKIHTVFLKKHYSKLSYAALSLQQSDMSIVHADFRSSAPAERYVIDEIN